jgi:hypothetical protein
MESSRDAEIDRQLRVSVLKVRRYNRLQSGNFARSFPISP